MFPALVCGNAVVFKPAEDVPHTGHVLVEILLEAVVMVACYAAILRHEHVAGSRREGIPVRRSDGSEGRAFDLVCGRRDSEAEVSGKVAPGEAESH